MTWKKQDSSKFKICRYLGMVVKKKFVRSQSRSFWQFERACFHFGPEITPIDVIPSIVANACMFLSAGITSFLSLNIQVYLP